MAITDNLLVSDTNLVPDSVITFNRTPVTSIDWLKTTKRARQTRWVNPITRLVVDFTWETDQVLQYFAVPGHNLKENATIQFIAYDVDSNVLADSGEVDIGELLAAGVFAAGLDPWNTTSGNLKQNILYILDNVITGVRSVRMIVEHNFTYDDPVAEVGEPAYVEEDDGIYQQDDSSGIVSVEAESCDHTPAGSDAWVSVADTSASNDIKMYKEGNNFYWSAMTGPQLAFTFKAADSGSHKIWARFRQTDGNSIYCSFDGQHKTNIYRDFSTFTDDTWQWREVHQVNLVAGNEHEVVMSARDHFLNIDKIVIQPSGDSTPTGEGPAESDQGTIFTQVDGDPVIVETKQYIDLRAVMIGKILQLRENFEAGASMRGLTSPDSYVTESGYKAKSHAQDNVRTFTINLAVMDPTDRRTLVTHEIEHNNRAFMLSAYPNKTGWIADRHVMLAEYDDSLEVSHDLSMADSNQDIYSTSITYTEV